MRVLYDGWALVHRPDSPAALHLADLLRRLPSGVHARVALPGQPFTPLPETAEGMLQVTPDHPAARLRWEQRILPTLARRSGAALLHQPTGRPPLFGRTRVLLSTEAGYADQPDRQALAARLGEAMAQGGLARGPHLLWPEDLPQPAWAGRVHRLPPSVPGEFSVDGGEEPAAFGLDLPERYALYHGPGSERSLRFLLASWSWAAAALGDATPLVAAGLSEPAGRRLAALLDEYGLAGTVTLLPRLGVAGLASVYRASAAVFHPAPGSPWTGPARLALACGRPLVALEDQISAALAGPAAYLVPPGPKPSRSNAGESPPQAGAALSQTTRLLGAALLTLLVEDDLAGQLAAAAAARSASWSPPDFPDRLGSIYSAITGR